MLIDRIVNYLEGAGASAQIAALAVIIAYICELLNWLPCLFERLCPNPVVVAVLGTMDSMGGVADAAFIIFIVIEGSGYMLFASMERNRLRAQVAEAELRVSEERRLREEFARQAAEANQRAAEANQQTAEAKQQMAEANQRTAEAEARTAQAELRAVKAEQRAAQNAAQGG